MKATDYEIVNHGYDHCQYFQGCGTYGTPFDEVFTGCADNAKEAYEYWGHYQYLWCAMADEDSTGQETYRAFVRAWDRKSAAEALGLTNTQLIKGV